MKDTLKRLTCMLLALIMVAGMFPVSVFAEAEDPISTEAGKTVSNVISPLLTDEEPEAPQEPTQDPVEEEDEEPAEEIPEAPAFDPVEPIKYTATHSEPFSVLTVLTNAGAPVNTIIGVAGDMGGKIASNASGSDLLLTPFNYFDKLELSVTAKDYPDGENAVYTVILSDPNPDRPAAEFSETMDDGVVVKAVVPEGALPAGIHMRVSPVDLFGAAVTVFCENGYNEEEAKQVVQALIDAGEDLSDYIAAYDICFYQPENPETEIEPKAPVEVTFEKVGIIAAGQDEVEAFHVADNGVVDALGVDATTDNGEVTATVVTGSFSKLMLFSNSLLEAGRSVSYNSPQEMVQDVYYTQNVETIHLNIYDVPTQTGESREVMAGSSELTYRVILGIDAALTYNCGWDNPPLFSTYDNVSVTITLPAGLTVVIPSDGISGVDHIVKDGQTWTFYLGQLDAERGWNKQFDFNVYVEDNGLLEIGHVFDVDSIPAVVHTEFTPYDKRAGSDPSLWVPMETIVREYNVHNRPIDAVSVSEDEWVVDKRLDTAAPHQYGYVVSDNKEKVTVYYKVVIGFASADSKSEIEIDYNHGAYLNYGRVPFESIYLTDTLSELKDRYGNVIQPESLVISKDPSFPEGDATKDLLTNSPVAVDINVGSEYFGMEIVGDTPQHIADATAKDVDLNAPYLTTYYVKAVYPYEKFIAEYYESNQEKLKVENNASITYIRKSDPEENSITAEDSADVKIGEVTNPAALNVKKLIKKYDSNETYGATTANHVTGTYKFKVFKVVGGTEADPVLEDAVLYTKNGDGTYSPFTGNEITLDLTDGHTGEYYLDPGTYIVRETDGEPATWIVVPEANKNTNHSEEIAAEGSVEFSFINEEKLGEIKVTKTDETGAPLTGATITVFEADGETVAKDAYGNDLVKKMTQNPTTFKNVKYGSYVVKETEAPANYIINMTPYPVTVDEQHAIGTAAPAVTIKNVHNIAKLNLSKLISTTTVGSDGKAKWEYLQSNFRSEYDKKFQLQESLDNGQTWQNRGNPVTYTSLTANKEVNYTWNLPVYVVTDNVQGNKIQYRIVETVPNHWYYVNADGTRNTNSTITSDSVTLTQTVSGVETVKDQTITFRDRKLMSIKLTKQFFSLNTSTGAMAEDKTREITVGLYKKVNGSYVQVGENITTTNRTYTWTDIQLFDDDGQKIEYYVKEVPVDGYTLTTTSVDGGFVRITDPAATLNPSNGTVQGSVALKNVENKVAVLVKKQDNNTGLFVPNAYVSVSHDGTTGKVYDPSTNPITEVTGKKEIVDGGTLLFLAVGDSYSFTEPADGIPDGYTWVSTTPDTIDLTDFTVSDSQQVQTVIIKNQSRPMIKVDKRIKYNLSASGNGSTLDGAAFEIYYKNESNQIVPYQVEVDGVLTTVTITAPNQEVPVDAGKTYYLHETNAYEKGAIDPDTNHDVYGSAVVEAQDGNWVFGPFEIHNQTGTTNVTVVTVTNAENKAGVKVYKQKWRGKDPQVGVSIGLLAGDETTPSAGHTGATLAPDGSRVFDNLPVYDENGQLITYTLYEIDPPAGYYPKVKSVKTTLVPGKTIDTKDGAELAEDGSNLLVLYNDILAGFNIGKRYFSDWEYTNYTQKTYALPGTEVAVYKKEADGTYSLVTFENDAGVTSTTVTTGPNGEIMVTGLEPESVYIAVEVDIPNRGQGQENEYLNPTMTDPATNPNPHHYDYRGYLTSVESTLTEAQLANLNYVIRPAAPEGADEDTILALGTELHNLFNVEDWAQIDVTKYVAEFEDGWKTPRPVNMDVEDLMIGDKAPHDHAIFHLYVQDLRETGPAYDSGASIRFDAGNCTFIKELTSGSFYDDNDERQKGEFVTPVLDCAPWLVYWLVEVDPADAALIPSEEITLYRHPLANIVNGENSTRTVTYKRNEVTEDDILNAVLPPDPGSSIRYASIRLSKWAAKVKGSGYDEENYLPLGGVTFNLSICDNNLLVRSGVIDSIIVGLDDAGFASGQSGDFVLIIKDNEITEFMVGTTDLMDYAQYVYKDEETNNYFFYVAIKEAGAPAEYTYDGDYYYEKVYFLAPSEGDDWTFNDAYLVTNATAGSENLAVDTQETAQVNAHFGDSVYGPFTVFVGSDYNRIVNYPVINNPVVVRKYGYIVNDENLGRNSEGLDRYYETEHHTGREKLVGVEMVLEKQVKVAGSLQWEKWAYNSKDNQQITEDLSAATFVTDENGIFRFPFGLTLGKYRIYEADIHNSAYENAYEGGWGENDYRYFTVENNTSRRITMYNPAKVSVMIEKTDPAGGALSGATFALVNKSAQGSNPEATTQGNKIVFAPVTTGFYYLSEGSAPGGFTKEYLQEYFHTRYAETDTLYPFADENGNGVWFGIEVSGENSENTDNYDPDNKGTIVTKYFDLSTGLEVIDPKLVDLKLVKQDLQNVNKKLGGVVFKVYQQLFDVATDNKPGNEKSYAIKDADNLAANTWTYVGEYTTDSDTGEIILDDQLPGVYVFVEQAAPEDYEFVNSKDQWWVVVTGGMNITVTGHDIDKTDTTMTNDYVVVTATNRKKAGVSIEKVFTESELSDIGEWTATFQLGTLNAAGTEMTVIEEVTLKPDPDHPEEIPSKTFTAQLSQGSTYYIRELPSTIFAFSKMTLNGEDMEKITLGTGENAVDWYKFTVNSAESISLQAENIALRGEIEIQKWDDIEKEDGSHELLSGASFKLIKVVDGVEETDPVEGAEWTELLDDQGKGTGKYVVSFPMSENAPATYRIYETDAPDGYLFQPDAYVEVVVAPGQHKAADASGVALHLINEGGFTIELIKYDNVYGTEKTLKPVTGAGFTLVQWDPAAEAWVEFATDTTDDDGKASFVARNGFAYAIYESSLPAGFIAIDSIHEVGEDGNPVAAPLAASDTLYNGTITVYALKDSDVTDWTVGETYVFNAYNQPEVAFQVRKRDVSGSSIVPAANYDVYKVYPNAGEDFAVVTDADVASILEGEGNYDTLKFEYIVTQLTGTDTKTVTDDTGSFTCSWSNVTGIPGGFTYLVIEKSVRGFNAAEPYDSLNKEDNRVVWWGTVEVPRDAAPAKPIESETFDNLNVLLKNVLGTASVTLTKDADNKTGRETLFKASQNVTYTLSPSVTNTTGLESFVVTDTGLKAYHEDSYNVFSEVYDTDTDSDGTLDAFRGYNIISVKTDENATHDPSIYNVSSAPISMVVSFYDFEGNQIGEDVTVAAGGTANKPEGNDAAKVEVRYVAYDLQSATRIEATEETAGFDGYALGKDFTPGDLTLNVVLKKHQDGPTVYTIDKIHNDSQADLSYRKFDADGQPSTKALPTVYADVDIFFVQPDIPPVEILKDSPAGSVVLGKDFDYIIKLTNTDPDFDLNMPFVVDLLPRGTTFDSVRLYDPANPDVEPTYDFISIASTNKYERGGEHILGTIPETAVRINMNGKLPANTEIYLKLTVHVDPEAALYGNTLENFAFMSSSEPTYKSTDNPTGAPFRDHRQDDKYAQKLPKVGAGLTPKLTTELADGLVEMLGSDEQGVGEFGYVGSSVSDPWAGFADIEIYKTIRGDQDLDADGNLLDFSTSRVAQASNGPQMSTDEGGWVEYQLVMTNTSATEIRDSIMFADVVPRPGDTQDLIGTSRMSEWQVNFGEIESVVRTTATIVDGVVTSLETSPINDKYKVYVYTGPLDSATDAIKTQLTNWQSNRDYENFAPGANWFTPASVANKASITAFVVLIDPSEVLKESESVIVTLKTNVKYYPEDSSDPNETTFFEVAYLNTINNFYTSFYTFTGTDSSTGVPVPDPVPSNRVTAMLLPDEVQVGGNIWIDADNNGLQDDGPFSDYTNDAIVKLLMESVSVNLNTYNNKTVGRTYSGGMVTPGFIYDNNNGFVTEKPDDYVKPIIFEGEPEFLFPHLRSNRFFTTPHYTDSNLRVDNLRGKAPSTYIIDIGISGEATQIFRLAQHSYDLYYQSDDPMAMPASAEVDCNFDPLNLTNTQFYNERFYLFATSKGEDTDMTKDCGFVPFRELWIKKVSEDDHDLALNGATFEMYGPYKRNTVKVGEYDPAILEGKFITTLETSDVIEDGYANKTDLLWYREYIIVETGAPEHYMLDGEVIETSDGAKIDKLADNTWILRVPDSKSTNTSEEVVISNPPSKAKATPHATKSLSGEPLEMEKTFTFSVTATSVVENGAYIAGNPDTPATRKYITIDDDTTTENEAYTVSTQITVTPNPTDPANPDIPEIIFEEITYILPGTYTYTIEEVIPSDGSVVDGEDENFKYDVTKWTYTVEAAYDDSTKELKVTESYQKQSEGSAAQTDPANFDNKYHPIPVKWAPQVQKQLTGDPLPENVSKSFTFKLTAGAYDPKTGYNPVGGADFTSADDAKEITITIPLPAGETQPKAFDDITFSKAGTYTFQVEEVEGSDTHITYAGGKVTFTVVVKDNKGQLEIDDITWNIEPASSNDVSVEKQGTVVTAKFTNIYTPEPTDYTPKVMKKIIGGKTEKDIKFKFQLTAGAGAYTETTQDDYDNPAGATLNNPTIVEIEIPAGKIDVLYEEAFGNIHFTKAGLFKFTVIEVKPGTGQGVEGIVYDPTVYTLEVNVTDVGGELKIVNVNDPNDPDKTNPKYTPKGYDPNTEDQIVDLYALFVNDYELTPTGYTPEVSKSMTMSKGKTKDPKEFTFTMTADPGNPAGATIKDNGTNPGNKATLIIPAGSTATETALFGEPTTTPTPDYYAIEFTAAGTYVFTIKEDIPQEAANNNNQLNGFTYDPAEWTLTIEVENRNSQLVVKSHIYEPKQADSAHQMNSYHAVFLNDYTPTPTDYTPKVNKSMTMSKGATTEDKTFWFTMSNPDSLTIDSHGGLAGTVAKLVIPQGSEDTVEAAFGKIHFTEAGKYTFTIEEDIPGDGAINPVNGITYDPVKWTLKVEVEDVNGALQVKGEPTYTPDLADSTHPENHAHAVFLNEATPKPTTLQLPVEKTLDPEGNKPPVEKTFTFTLTLDKVTDAQGTTIEGISDPTSSTATVTVSTTGTIVTGKFETITYEKAGIYTYTVKEDVSAYIGNTNWTCDLSVYEVVVTVTAENDKLSAGHDIFKIKDSENHDLPAPEKVTSALFTNKYVPTPTEDNLKAKKVLRGETWPNNYNDRVFTFTEKYLRGDLSGFEVDVANGATVPTAANDYVIESFTMTGAEALAGTEKPFKTIKFTSEGTYVFAINEAVPSETDQGFINGVDFDGTIWEVTVVVTDNDGKLEHTISYKPKIDHPDQIHMENDEHALFSNGYDNGTVLYTPLVEKKVIDDYGPLVSPKTFNFKLTPGTDDYNNPPGASLSLSGTNRVDEVSITISTNYPDYPVGSAYFNGITFTEQGTFKFTAKETVVDGNGSIIYSDVIWILTVVVNDDGGSLSQTHSYSDGTTTVVDVGNLPARATFTNRYIPKPTYYQPEVKKTVPGNRLSKAMDFSFTLTLTSQPAVGALDISGVWKDISEPGEEANWQAMPTNGTDSVTVTVPVGSTGATETGLFKNLKFVKAGTYKFTIAEDTPSGYNGITDDTTVWTLTVVVVDTDGKLEVDTNSTGYSYVDSNGTHAGTEASFSNPYKPEPTYYTPLVDKTMTTEFGPTVVEKTFKFTMTLDSQVDPDNKPMTDGANIPAGGDKATIVIPANTTDPADLTVSGSFGEIEFVKAGTYKFTIEEDKPSGQNGITDDTAVWTLTIVVQDKDGKLVIDPKPEYKPAKEDGNHQTNQDSATFTNPYKPTPTHYQPLVDKTMTTEFGPTTEDKTFNFTLKLTEQKDAAGVDMTDGAIIPTNGDKAQIVVPEGKSNASGSFGDIDFVKAGTYVFEIKEVEGTDPSITYDGTTWTLTVEVTDEDGKLTETHTYSYTDATGATVTVTDTAAIPARATFTNPYKPKPTEYQPKVRKDIELVTGAPTTLDKHFTFDLEFYSAFTDDWEKLDAYQLDAEESAGGKKFVSDTVTVTIPAGETTTADLIPFKTIHFTRAGRYTYKITERVTIPELGMTYDQAEWTLTIIVRDNNGVLEIADANYTSNWTNSRENREAAKFVNPYTTGNLRVTKRVSGTGASTSTKFTFKVTLYTENVGGERTPLPGTYPVEIYNNKTGELVDTATVENGTATFKLKHEQTAIIRNIPVGVKWEVEEERAFGYATSAETPNKGTIQKGENISNWKNHRSTVPPIPRTGYGDGTTVKVGLGTSLGVFLASAIGSILQSKNSKKKKRGGGSHAAN